MSNSSVVTAFRDALRQFNIIKEQSISQINANKEKMIRQLKNSVAEENEGRFISEIKADCERQIVLAEEDYIQHIESCIAKYTHQMTADSTLTKKQLDLSMIELQMISFEFGQPYSERDLVECQQKLQTLTAEIEEENRLAAEKATNSSTKKWSKIHPEQNTGSMLPSFSRKSPLTKNTDQIRIENLLNKTEDLLKKAQEKKKAEEQILLDMFLSSINNTLSFDTMRFMFNFIQFRQACKDKEGNEGGTEDVVKELKEYAASLSEGDLKRNYEKMRSPEIVSLVNLFFTQRHILQYGEDIDKNDSAFSDALSVWPMNKAWMRANIYESITKTPLKQALSQHPEQYAEKAFITAAAQFYTLLMNVYESFSAAMVKRRLKGYMPCFLDEIQTEANQEPRPHTLYLGFKDDVIVYRTNMSKENCTLSKQDCLSAGYNSQTVDTMFNAIKEVLHFNPDASNIEDVATKLSEKLSEKHIKRYLRDIINEYFGGNQALLSATNKIANKRGKIESESLKAIIENFAIKPEAIRQLTLNVKHALLENTMIHFLDNIILNITVQRGHTLPSQSSPFLSDWPMNQDGRPKKIILSAEEKRLIGECVKANNPISKDRVKLKMKENYWYGNKPTTYYFGKVIHSLGGYFNLNRFSDFLLTTEFSKLHEALANADPMVSEERKKLQSIYQSFQDSDLSRFVLLLKTIKEGSDDKHKEIYQWLGLKNPNAFLDKRFQEVVHQLYTAADDIMQMLRKKLAIPEDYKYNNLELKQTGMLNSKNSASLKRLLVTYAEATPNIDLSYTLSEQFSLFWNPGAEIKVEAENNYLKKLVCETPFPTPIGTPFDTPAPSPKNSSERYRTKLGSI